jgi:hypothetical protein
MINKARSSSGFYLGLNRERIKYGLYIKQLTGDQGVHAGSVVVETQDVTRADFSTEIPRIEASGTIRPPLNILQPNAYHPALVNTTFVVNRLMKAGLYLPLLGNVGYQTTFVEIYDVVHGSGNFTPPVYVTSF